TPMLFDAAWTPRGAYCIGKERWLKLQDLLSDIFRCKAKFLHALPLVDLKRASLTKPLAIIDTSPVDPLDVCVLRRSGDRSRSEVLLDNQSGLHLKLTR